MANEEPLVLPVGTEVSAKYRGAFCEAKVKKIVRLVKCKVTITEPKSQLVVLDENVTGTLKVSAKVEIKHPDSGLPTEATINKLTDCSMYTVVFDDGDENTLRRTQLCLKGEKHFVKSETLDQLPLTHPEHFGTPVMKNYKGTKRRRAATASGGATANISDSESESEDSVCSSPRKRIYKGRLAEMIGRVLCMEIDDRKKTTWVPVLVIIPSASDMELKTRDHLLVKSFKDSRIHTVARKDTKEFTRDMAIKNEDKTLKPAMEKALAYFDSRDLPSNWDREELLGIDSDDDDESDDSDDVPSEEKDHFVAQLYKFMDDRDTPINKPPTIGANDINLYRLFMLVRNLGGYNKVTNLMKWKMVYSKMNLPPSSNAYNQIKAAYKKYLHAYEDFYRKLGSTMGNTRSRTRHTSGRSLLSFRERESGQPKSPRTDKKKEEKVVVAVVEEKEDDKSEEEKDESKSKDDKKDSDSKGRKSAAKEEDPDNDSPRKRRSRAEKKLIEEKEEKPTSKRVTREEASKMKDEVKVKEEERPRRSTSKKTEEEEKEDIAQKRRGAVVRKKVIKVEEKDTKKKPKEEPVSDGGPDEDSDDGEDDDGEVEPLPPPPKDEPKSRRKELALGTKLKVRYGRGRNQKIYEAKVVEAELEGGSTHYLVHYAGWNTRYDEWVQRDRIVAVVSEGAEPEKKIIPIKKIVTKTGTVKKLKRPGGGPSPTPTPSKPEIKTPKSKPTTPVPTPSSSKPRPTRSSGTDAPPIPLPTRRSRRGSGVGDNASDITSHVSESESDMDESLTDEKKVETDDTDSVKTKPEKSADTRSKGLQGKTKTAKKDKDLPISDSESESSELSVKETKTSSTKVKQGQSKVKAEVKQESGERSDDDNINIMEPVKKTPGKSTPTRPGKTNIKTEEAAPSPATSSISANNDEPMDTSSPSNKASELLAKDEDAQSEDDILKDLKVNHHIDMGDILVYPGSGMSIAAPKPKTTKETGVRGKRRKSTDSNDEVSRQDSLDTVAYGYDIQDAVQNILDQLDEGDDDSSDDLSFLKQPIGKKPPFSVEADKKEDKVKKDKKVEKEKVKEKTGEKGKGKAVKKVEKAATVEETKADSDTEKKQEGDKKKKTKKKKVKKKVDGEKDADTSIQTTPEKEVKVKVEQDSASNLQLTPRAESRSEEVRSPPQLAAVTPNKDKEIKTELTGHGEVNSLPPKLQAERLDLPLSVLGVAADKKPVLLPSAATNAASAPHIITATTTKQEPGITTPTPTTSTPTPTTTTSQKLPSPAKATTPPSSSPPSLSTPPSSSTSSTLTSSTSTATKSLPSTPMSSMVTPSKFTPVNTPAAPIPHSAPLLKLPTVTASSPRSSLSSTTTPAPTLTPAQSAAPVVKSPVKSEPAAPTAAPSSGGATQQPASASSSSSSLVPPVIPGGATAASAAATPSSATLYNTPPETPEGSPQAPPPLADLSKSPTPHRSQEAHAAHTSGAAALLTAAAVHAEKSKLEAESSLVLPPGGESPNACDTSTISNGSEGSSGNMPSSEDSTEGSTVMTHVTANKRKMASTDDTQPPPKKRKPRSKRSSNIADKGKTTPKHTMSDSDEGPEPGSSSPKNIDITPSKATPSKVKGHLASPSPSVAASPARDEPRAPRPSKYNFNLEEGNYLEGEQRIYFIMEKLTEIRKIYLGLKNEVAGIDRRRKRAKRREKEGTAMALASLANS